MAIFYTDSGSFNSLQVTGSTIISASSGIALQLKGSGSTILSVSGSNGEIFNISDAVSTNLFSVSSGSLEIFSIDTSKVIKISGSLIVTGSITGSLFGTASYALQAVSSSYATSASYAISASQAVNSLTASYINPLLQDVQITGSLNISGGLNIVGNQTTIGNRYLTGSWNVTGSSTLIGNTLLSGNIGIVGTSTLTGSFLVSGSTTQIGNNTLLGDTLLSGSVNMSGNILITGSITATNQTASFGYVSASFLDVTGKQTVRGYTQYIPTSDIVPISTVGGYIYSSGSQGDLYFAQTNGSLNNVIRLRWLEGNMYSGLLNGGVITTQSSTVYQVSSGSGIIVSLNGSLSTDPYPTVQYISWSNLSSSIAPLSASYDQSFIAIEPSASAGILHVQGIPYDDGQFNTLIPIGNVIHQNRSSINATATYPSVAYGYKQRSSDFIRAFGPLKLSGLNTIVSGSSTGSLQITSGTSYNEGRNYVNDVNNPSYVTDSGQPISKIFRYYQSGSSWVYLTNGGAGFETIDPTQYSLNGVLTPVPGTGANREFTIQRVYYFPSGATKGIYVYYGNATYTTLVEAIANIPYENFTEAPNTAAGAILSAHLIVRNNADFTVAESYNIRAGGLFRNVGGAGGGGSAVTQTLAGLSDVTIATLTNGQPLVYDSTSLKWENKSTLVANLVGTASYAVNTSPTFPFSGSAIITGSLLVSGSTIITGSINVSGGQVKVDGVNILDTALAYAIALG